MDMNQFSAGKYLKAIDYVDEDPREVVIRAVKSETVGQKEELKGVVYLQGEDRGIILNKTNNKMLVNLFGRDSDGWIGQRVMLAVQQVDFQGDSVPGFRFAPIKRKAPKPASDAASKPAPKPVVDEPVDVDDDGLWNEEESA